MITQFQNLIVCVKQVPDPHYFSKIAIDPLRKTIRREKVPSIINPLDKHALEEALRLKDKYGSRITVISMGPHQAQVACKEALAMGADEAILFCDKLLSGADTLATSYSLSLVIKKLQNFDLILCGNETVDGGTSQVPPQLAEFLGIPHVTRVRKIDVLQHRKLLVERTIEHGHMVVEVKIPAVIAVTKELNNPRIPTVEGIILSSEKQITIWSLADIEVYMDKIGLNGSPTRVTDIFIPELKRRREIIKDRPEEASKLIVKRLHELGVL